MTAAGGLGPLLATSYDVKDVKANQQAAMTAASRYEGEEVIALETQRAEERQKQIVAATHKFIESPVLILPLSKDVRYSFDPNDVMAVDASNTVYPTMRLVDTWGILEVSKGAWLTRDDAGLLHRAQVLAPRPVSTSGPSSGSIDGEGWSLTLNDGWKIVAGERAGDFAVVKADAKP